MSLGCDEYATAIADAVRAGARRRIVAPGGMGKTRLLDHVGAALGDTGVVRWNAAFDSDPVPADDRIVLADDLHVADGAALQVLARRPGGVVAAHRPADGVAAAILDAIDGTPLVLARLGHDDVGALLADLWGTPPTPEAVDEVLALTAGVPRLVLAVASAAAGRPLQATPVVDEVVRSERRRLGPNANALLTASALLGDVDRRVLAIASGLETPGAAPATEQLAAASFTTDSSVRIVPVVAEVVRRSTPPQDVAAVVEQAARATLQSGHDPIAIAERARALGVTGPMTARCLLLAARQVLDETPQRARSLLDAARGTAVPADLAAMRALVGFRQGHADETITAVDTLLTVEPRWATGALQREAVETAAVVLAQRRAWSRSAALAEAVGPLGDNAVAIATLAWVAIGDADGARRALLAYEGNPPPGLRSEAAVTLARGLVASCADDPAPALPLLLDAARLAELAPGGMVLPETPHALAAVVACHLWEFDVAAQILADAPSRRRGDPHREELLRAWVALRRGDWAGAQAMVTHLRATTRALDARDAIVADAVEAGVARRRGDLETLAGVWRRARNLLLRQVPDVFLTQPTGELLIAGARLEDRGTVATCLAGVRQVVARAGAPLWTLSLLWDELHVAMALNDRAAAKAAAKAAATLPELGARASAVTRAAICWTDALAGRAEPERVRATAQALADAGLVWESARLAGAAAIRVSDTDQMRMLLRFARSVSADRDSALAETATDLSPRERDVAIHLLAGLTYREIGGQLFIAPKTVEHHVARMRRKVGARSRAELVLALQRAVGEGEGERQRAAGRGASQRRSSA